MKLTDPVLALVLGTLALGLSSCGDEARPTSAKPPEAELISPAEAGRLWRSTEGDSTARGARRHRVAVAVGRRQLLADADRSTANRLLGKARIHRQKNTIVQNWAVGVYRARAGGCTEILSMTFDAQGGHGQPHVQRWCVDNVEIEP